MSKTSWWDDVDEMFDFIDGDDARPKKKKKKKKAKDKAGGLKVGIASYERIWKSLKGMKKSELLQRMDTLGIPLDGVDVTSKRALKDAIACHMSGNTGTFAATQSDKVPVGLSRAEHEQRIQEATRQLTERPPYYIDEDTEDFIIPNCVRTTDMDCFNGMMSLGMYRRKKNPDDGFGELMNRLSRKLAEMPDASPSQIIDVTDFQVIEEPKALPPAKAEEDDVLAGVDVEKVVTRDVLDKVDVEKMSSDIDKALERRAKKRNRKPTT